MICLNFKGSKIFVNFENFDSYRLSQMKFEITVNDFKIAEFNDFDRFKSYVETLSLEMAHFNWLFTGDNTIAFNFYSRKK